MVNDAFTHAAAAQWRNVHRGIYFGDRVHDAPRRHPRSRIASRALIVPILGKCRSLKFS
jgi:hypothetical protein